MGETVGECVHPCLATTNVAGAKYTLPFSPPRQKKFHIPWRGHFTVCMVGAQYVAHSIEGGHARHTHQWTRGQKRRGVHRSRPGSGSFA